MRKLLFSLVFITCVVQAFAQSISGVVTDKNSGTTLPGASIVVKGTSVGTITDMDGKFTVQAPANSTTLVFSFVGYKTQEVAINGQSVINVQLESDEQSIDEVVVVGYGTQKKSLVTGAIAKVDNEELVKGSNLRVTQAIQGKTAGVVISNNSGQPGEFVSVRIRGAGTVGDAEPLYIVDGLPSNGNAVDYLNPADIESVEVLKDAASSSIYGARGANGVVLITTKSGKKAQRFEISYDGYTGMQNPWRKISVLNAQQYVEMMNESAANAGQTIPYPQSVLDTMKYNTDWQDEMFNYDAKKTSHVISFTGGSENSTYSSSFSYFKQDGIVAKGKSQFERYTYRLNTTREFNVLNIGTNFTYAHIENKGIDANDRYGVSLAQAINLPPIIPVKYAGTNTWATPEHYGIGMQEITNPVALLSVRNSNTVTNKVIGGVSAEFDFGKLIPALSGLKFKSSYGMDLAYVNSRSYDPVYNFSSTKYNIISKVSTNMDKWVRWNIDNLLIYDKTFGENHISGLLGHSAYKDWHLGLYAGKGAVIFDDFSQAYLDNATDDKSATAAGGYYEHTILSYFGRINYDLSNKYMLTAVVRADGSSRFGPNNKFGIFPSVSGGWVISNEDFFNFGNVMNLLKFRASWGRNGNESIGDFAYTSKMSYGNIYYFGNSQTQYNGVQPAKIANPDLKWETSQQIDFALDMAFFNSRVNLTLDYYRKKTIDWLVDAPAPLLIGNVPPTINGGSVENRGIEFELGMKNKISDFSIDFSLTGAFNKNEVTDIKNSEKVLSGGDGGFGQSGILRAQVGKPIGFFYGYQVAGVFQNQAEVDAYVDANGKKVQPNAVPGDFKFVDQNGDGKLTDEFDRIDLGNSTPDFTGGLNVSASWKGVDFNMFWYTALGHQVWMALRRYDQVNTNYTTDFYENRWTGEGTTNEYPRITHVDANNNWKTPSSFYVKDASFVRLKNISLGYTLPKSVSEKLLMSKLRIYVSGENMLTFTKYPGFDPEIGGGAMGSSIDRGIYPQARTVLGGISITF